MSYTMSVRKQSSYSRERRWLYPTVRNHFFGPLFGRLPKSRHPGMGVPLEAHIMPEAERGIPVPSSSASG